MCVYGKDNPTYFDAALNSIVNQTLKPTEIVLTIDGPIPEEIEKIIKKYQENYENIFRVIRLEKNMGHGKARRVCFDNCSHPIIALMDADDLAVPTRFEKQVAFFNTHSDVSVVGGYITEFISSENPTDISRTAGRRVVPETDDGIQAYMKKTLSNESSNSDV